jgi:hypothetical protein
LDPTKIQKNGTLAPGAGDGSRFREEGIGDAVVAAFAHQRRFEHLPAMSQRSECLRFGRQRNKNIDGTSHLGRTIAAITAAMSTTSGEFRMLADRGTMLRPPYAVQLSMIPHMTGETMSRRTSLGEIRSFMNFTCEDFQNLRAATAKTPAPSPVCSRRWTI